MDSRLPPDFTQSVPQLLPEQILLMATHTHVAPTCVRIKGRSPAVQTFIGQLASGGAYLPTARAVVGGAYGAIAKSCNRRSNSWRKTC